MILTRKQKLKKIGLKNNYSETELSDDVLNLLYEKEIILKKDPEIIKKKDNEFSRDTIEDIAYFLLFFYFMS